MNEWDKLTIHIGMPKSASTSLQCNFFSKIGCSYLGPTDVHFNFKKGLEERFKYLLALSTMEEYRYQEYKDDIKSFLHRYFSPEKPGVISDEGISCGYYGAVLEECNDRTVVANRYAELFEGAKILFIIRNQFDFLASLFGEWNRRTFINEPNVHRWLDECFTLHANMVSNPLCMPDYWGIYRIYSDLFDGRIKVLPLEKLKMDARGFLDEIAEFAGLKIPEDVYSRMINTKLNTRTRLFEKKVSIFLNGHPGLKKMIPDSFQKPLRSMLQNVSPELQVEFDIKERQHITNIYASGNRLLMEKTGLQLDQLGYPL